MSNVVTEAEQVITPVTVLSSVKNAMQGDQGDERFKRRGPIEIRACAGLRGKDMEAASWRMSRS